MAVYTHVPFEDLQAFVRRYDIGMLLQADKILAGVENSNYLLTTSEKTYILTLFEKRVKESDLPFFIGLMQHAAQKGLICPLPLPAADGTIIQHLYDRPAIIVSFLHGEKTDEVSLRHCRQVGGMMAELHEYGSDFAIPRPNPLSLSGWEKLTADVLPRADELAPGLADLIADELAYQQKNIPATGTLPSGPIHADIFMDNVFFQDGTFSGLIDFYFACNDFLVYDVAITINAWCFRDQKVFEPMRARSILEGYYLVRALNDEEYTALPTLLRGASLRFLLTRAYDKLNHPPGAHVTPHDPLEYRDKLLYFREHGLPL